MFFAPGESSYIMVRRCHLSWQTTNQGSTLNGQHRTYAAERAVCFNAALLKDRCAHAAEWTRRPPLDGRAWDTGLEPPTEAAPGAAHRLVVFGMYAPARSDSLSHRYLSHPFRRQPVNSQHSPTPDTFSPMFSNAAAEHASPGRYANEPTSEQKRSAQQRSEPNGDHHLMFLDVADSDPAGH